MLHYLKLYLQTIALLATVMLVFGFYLPGAISSKNGVDVMAAIFVLIFVTPVQIVVGIHIVRAIKSALTSKKESTNEA